jgi:hypothetical protein
VTHTLANLSDYCDDLIILAPGGHLAFAGGVAEALAHFGAATLGDVLAEIEERGIPKKGPSEHLPQKEPADAAVRLRTTSNADLLHQFATLVHRNFRLVLADRRALLMAAVQSVIIGGLLGYSFSDFGRLDVVRAGSQRASLLLLAMTSLWMGCNTASKEIVGERAIFLRERDVNLSPFSFVLAKFVVVCAFAMLQVAALSLMTAVLIDSLPGGLSRQLPALLIGAVCGVALGLLISSLCTTRDQASIIVPLAVAPQLILGGGLAPMLPKPALALTRAAISVHHVRLIMEHSAGLAASLGVAAEQGNHSALLGQIVALLIGTWWVTSIRNRR